MSNMYSPTIIFSVAAFVGNFGVALTGFGMAIFFLTVYVSYAFGRVKGAINTTEESYCIIRYGYCITECEIQIQ